MPFAKCPRHHSAKPVSPDSAHIVKLSAVSYPPSTATRQDHPHPTSFCLFVQQEAWRDRTRLRYSVQERREPSRESMCPWQPEQTHELCKKASYAEEPLPTGRAREVFPLPPRLESHESCTFTARHHSCRPRWPHRQQHRHRRRRSFPQAPCCAGAGTRPRRGGDRPAAPLPQSSWPPPRGRSPWS